MSGHATAVATLCAQAGAGLGLGAAELTALRRAAYLHDLGAASVSVSVWERAGPLSADEWERVRLHPYYTERVLTRAPALAPLGRIAALHHERLDGSGYHEGDYVAILHTHHARSTGPFLGSPPTGAWVVVPGIELFRFHAGKIAEFWRFDADVALLGQLGLLPAPQPSA